MSNLAYGEPTSEPVSEKQITSASICAVLTQLDIQDIVETIDHEYYSDKKWHYRFS